ncbi:GNAT family N-acetyltransferase [Flammeovirga agarivorans]|uniref:GNAT family N-acetyltransferase n=1 Tax=Flammeovirga agarivorans TaxID=2726742 RepID=A0A7X8SK48_9BACT|nr:GNAT family protein [Flammeovirga agarivorans]NLR91719.1 GNAT family N-acetyltransferase [Flammeovirga agarivorans]
MKLESKRLEICPINLRHKEEIFEYRKDKEANKYQSWIPENLESVEAFINKVHPKVDVPDTWFQVVIIEKKLGKVIGDIGIHFLEEESQQVDIGYTLHQSFQGKGYATEAVGRVIDYLFIDLNKHRITASLDPENIKSIQLLERIGFRKEAYFKESLWIDGKWVDDIIYGMLKKEWKNR